MNKVEEVVFNTLNGEVDYQTYLKVVDMVNKITKDVAGEAAAEYYDVFRKLLDSENNAGWEERHKERIQTLNDAKGKICLYFEEYLP